MNEEDVVSKLKEAFGDKVSEFKTAPRRVFFYAPPEYYKEVVRFLAEKLGFVHLQAITATDLGDEIEVMPHLGRGLTVSVRTRVPKDKPVVDSVVDVIPGASVHEREAHDMLGVEFRGNPNLTRILLPEDWPKGVYPLRRETKLTPPKPIRGGKE
ncbi:NADH-quinone oxidoreductase subunit C [Candidatus Bathyarchaeota archaeon]|nr:MAG: NADH-quinone oxidoreductase subunit C [Candidatus Bathyarchaeota archaeon]